MPSSPPSFPTKSTLIAPSTSTPIVSSTRGPIPPSATTTASPPPSTSIPDPAPGIAGPSVVRPVRGGLTPAEAYANAHYPRPTPPPPIPRDRITGLTGGIPHTTPGGAVSKPIFDWISRKLGGAGRRATVAEFSPVGAPLRDGGNAATGRGRYPTLPRHGPAGGGRRSVGPVAPAPPPTELSTFTRQPRTSPGLSRAESQSLRSYSFSPVSERRQEANNPYPSIPVPLLQQQHRETSTIDVSFLSRSRTPSLRSEASLTSSFPHRVSLLDDGSSSFRLAGRVADEDASVRPLPPSHRGSPTPSASRSASISVLSPQPSRRPTSPSLKLRDTASMGGDRSFVSSEQDEGRQSRRDSSRRDSASTKPTTIVSVDGPLPTTHIAQSTGPSHQVPPSPLRGSISRDAPVDATVSPQDAASASPIPPTTPTLGLSQAPKHSHPHPRDNPRPGSPPDSNASTLTLASSTFAAPAAGSWTPSVPSLYHRPSSLNQLSAGAAAPWSGTSPISTPLTAGAAGLSTGNYRPTSLATSPSVSWAQAPGTGPGPDRNSTADYPPSLHPTMGTSFRTGGWAGGRGAADRDASVRAVRRKGSWESNESGWSWRGANGGVISPTGGTPGGYISPGPLLSAHTTGSGSGSQGGLPGVEHTPRLSLLASPLDLTPPIDLTDGMDRMAEDQDPRGSRQLRIDTGIAA